MTVEVTCGEGGLKDCRTVTTTPWSGLLLVIVQNDPAGHRGSNAQTILTPSSEHVPHGISKSPIPSWESLLKMLRVYHNRANRSKSRRQLAAPALPGQRRERASPHHSPCLQRV